MERMNQEDAQNVKMMCSKIYSGEDEFSIVPATKDDMSTVAALVRSSASWYEPIVDEKDMSEHEVDAQWAEDNFKRRSFFLAKVDGEAIGTISLQFFEGYTYLGYIYLDVNHVGKGYGGRLMRFAETVSKRLEMDAMVLIGHPEAVWAKKAYLKFGFEIAASKKQDVLKWQGGALKPYYEEDFELYVYPLHEDFAINNNEWKGAELHVN